MGVSPRLGALCRVEREPGRYGGRRRFPAPARHLRPAQRPIQGRLFGESLLLDSSIATWSPLFARIGAEVDHARRVRHREHETGGALAAGDRVVAPALSISS